MKTHVEIRIRLKLNGKVTLHDVLQEFASQAKGWSYPAKQSEEYQNGHRSPAGFAVCDSMEGLERAAVAIANVNQKFPNSFMVPNIVPRNCSSLTLDQYNAIGLAFASDFGRWLRKSHFNGTVRTIGPEKTLSDIIPGKKSRSWFESWLHTPTPLSHPSDLHVLDCFICHLFRHPGTVRTHEIGSYLIHDRGWKPEAARTVMIRIETGLGLLRVDRRF